MLRRRGASMTDATHGQSMNKSCVRCYDTDDTEANPLLELDSDNSEAEFIHRRCALTQIWYGFCWCCGTSKVFYAEDLNEAGECEMHDGESVPDYSEEDGESFMEYIRNNL